jgi:hypothetical protein
VAVTPLIQRWAIGIICAAILGVAAGCIRRVEPTPPEPVRPASVIRPAPQFRPVPNVEGVQEATLVSEPIGGGISAHLEVRTVGIPGGREVTLPIEYDGVLEVRTGGVTTIAGTERQVRRRGEMWQVSRQTQVVLAAAGELAVLRAVYLVPESR